MEADWSVEIGSDAPVIHASWEGFVDLRGCPDAVEVITEAAQEPKLREILLALNSQSSPMFTTKCDMWRLAANEIDPDEFGAQDEDARFGFASYVDIVEREAARFASFECYERLARGIATRLRMVELRRGRVDVVVRAAVMNGNDGYGLTLYAAGCGRNEADAHAAWQEGLRASVAATMATAAQSLP